RSALAIQQRFDGLRRGPILFAGTQRAGGKCLVGGQQFPVAFDVVVGSRLSIDHHRLEHRDSSILADRESSEEIPLLSDQTRNVFTGKGCLTNRIEDDFGVLSVWCEISEGFLGRENRSLAGISVRRQETNAMQPALGNRVV